jgi:plastocyanin
MYTRLALLAVSLTACTPGAQALAQGQAFGYAPLAANSGKRGTYLYGCFFHYGATMRGVIVAQ